jgi:hypothetical protein
VSIDLMKSIKLSVLILATLVGALVLNYLGFRGPYVQFFSAAFVGALIFLILRK